MLQQVAEQHPGKRIVVWFQDEGRFGQQGTLTRQWAPRGSRPPAVKQTQYDYLYVLAAASPQTGQTVGLLAPQLNTAIINAFFRQFEQEVDPETHVVLFWDQAGYHTARDVKPPPNVTLIPLPPYSPELNPIENLWHYLRSHYWSNNSYEDYDELRDAACDAWQRSCLDAALIRTVCRVDYLEPRNVKV